MPRHASYYPMARTAHVERLVESKTTALFYRDTRGDWDTSSAPSDKPVVQTSTRAICRMIASGEFDVLEIPEPLAVRLLPDLFLLSTTWRLTPRARRPRFVCYSIENRDQAEKLGKMFRSASVGRVTLQSFLAYILPTIDKMAFGTSGSLALYEAECRASTWQRFARRARIELFEALPKPEVRTVHKEPGTVLFVGTFDDRKGFSYLTRAWPKVLAHVSGASLTIICPRDREREESAREWCDTRPEVTLELDPPRSYIREKLAASSVLTLPSRRTATWREQVGLPIVEALSYGCTVVTTTETGIAHWLQTHGHRVIASEYSPDDLAGAIVDALDRPVAPRDVLASLPDEDQRMVADEWMFRDGSRHG